MNNWHQRVSLKLGGVKNYSWGIAACLSPECTGWPTVIIIKACESKACHSESTGQRGQCSISRDLGTHCEDEVTWDRDDDNTDFETCACSKFCWLVTEFSNLFSVLHEILAFSLHPAFMHTQKVTTLCPCWWSQQGGWITESQNGWGWKAPLEVIWSNSTAQAGWPGSSCPGTYPNSF